MNAANELTCKELVELVTEYLEGALPAVERMRFEAHLANCEGCTTYLEHMQKTIHLLDCHGKDHVSPEAQEKLLGAFRDWKTGR